MGHISHPYEEQPLTPVEAMEAVEATEVIKTTVTEAVWAM